MESKMIVYDLKSQNIISLTNEQKRNYFSIVLNQLQKTVANYFNQNLSDQETFLFNFPESNKLSKDKNLFYSTIKKLIEEIKNSKYYEYTESQQAKLEIEKGRLKLNYEEICGLVNFIILIINHIKKKKEEQIYKFSFSSELPDVKNIEIKKIKLPKLVEKTNFVKILDVCLSDTEKKEKIDIKVIQLFCFFYKAFFPNLLTISIDLNVYEINKYFDLEVNPYKIKEEKILLYGKNFEQIFLGNLIIMKKLTNIVNMSIKMYDSYQLELHHLMTNHFQNKSKDGIEIKNAIPNSNYTPTPNPNIKTENIFLIFKMNYYFYSI